MSREVRRVPLDFSWPLDKVWEGYRRPERLREAPCPDCRNGMTWAAEWVYRLGERIDMLARDIGEQARGLKMHPYLADDMDAVTTGFVYEGDRLVSTPEVMRPTRDVLEFLAGLTGDSPERLMDPLRGMDYRVGRKLIEAAGLNPETWGVCRTCEGHGAVERYPGQRAEADAWEQTEPPTGEGWQLWETVSEGSPVTPVFESADALARHLTERMGFNPGAARTLVEQGSTIGSFVGVGRTLLRSAEDADMVAALTDPDIILTDEDRAAAQMEADQ